MLPRLLFIVVRDNLDDPVLPLYQRQFRGLCRYRATQDRKSIFVILRLVLHK